MQVQKAILIVGGAGYIGSHTAKLLHTRGYKPVVLDDLSTGHHEAVHFGPFHEGSYRDIPLVEKLLREHAIDTVMHFGAKALVPESVSDPLLYYSANVGGTIDLLTAMRKAHAKYFIFSSTCATFGEPKESPIHERLPQNPVNPYGQSKLFVERILADLDRLHGMRSAVLRYFNAAGADAGGELGEDHDPETHLIPRALRVVLGLDAKLTVYGKDYATPDGSCVRDYVHVEDLAAAHVTAMERLWKKDESFDVNLGTEHGSSVLEVLHMIEKVAGKKVAHSVGARRPGDPPKLIADSRKAHELLGWRPQHDLESVVRTAYEWMKKHPQGYRKSGR